MKCPRCFNEITDSSTTCPNCGLELFAQNVDVNNLDKKIKKSKNAKQFIKDLPMMLLGGIGALITVLIYGIGIIIVIGIIAAIIELFF